MDLALNPDAPEYGPEVAQLPEPSPFQKFAPAPPLPGATPEPTPTPVVPPAAGGQGDQTAVQTGTPPPQQPTALTPEQQAAADAAELEEQKAADLEEEQQAKVLRSHHGNYDVIPDTADPTQHPDYAKWQRAAQLLAQASKAERAQYKPLVDGLKAKVIGDTKAQNDKVKQSLKVEAIQADAKNEALPARDRTYEMVGTIVDKVGGDFTTKAQDRDPATAKSADFTVKTSPLTTMSLAHKDGTVTYEPLRNAATSIAVLNGGIPADRAVQAVLKMASPYGFDEKTGKPLVGINEKSGPGARAYQVIGRDVRDNYIVALDNGRTHLRVDPDTMAQIRSAQQMGWKAAKQWHADQVKAANSPDLLTRIYRSVVPGKGF